MATRRALPIASGPQGWQASKRPVLMRSEAYRFDLKHVPCRLFVLCRGWLPPASSRIMGPETRMPAALYFLAWGLCWPSRLFACDIQGLARKLGFHLPGARGQWLLEVTHGPWTQWKHSALSSKGPGVTSSLLVPCPSF